MSILLTSDLHLTDRDRDEYRWGLFPWLKEQIAVYKPRILLLQLFDFFRSKKRKGR